MSRLRDFISRELRSRDPGVREANAQLARCAAMFLASVFVFRTFGDAFAV